MNNLKDKVAIVGLGWTKFSSNSGVSVKNLALEACKNAIVDAGLTVKDVDGIATFNMGDSVSPYVVATGLGLPELRWCNEYFAGANGATSTLLTAACAVIGGLADNILVFRAMNGRTGMRLGGAGQSLGTSGIEQYCAPFGLTTFPQAVAMMARRHMIRYGTTSQQMAAIAVTCRENACLNERAVARKPLTLEDHQNSKMIVDPFRLYDCCQETDGACATLITSADRARDLKHSPVYLMSGTHGAGWRSGEFFGKTTALWPEWKELSETYAKTMAPQLFGKAGITPKDIDVAELYDCFSIEPIIQLEDFGFCKKGEGGPFVESGAIKRDGKLPMNTHGGLLSEGYIHGFNHVLEAVSQLRGDAGERQIKDAEISLVTGYCGPVGNAIILRR
ncbi:acetyl-CoA acetyltransferase [Thermodesulfobacteriota bacterium]